jgi:hypothetical protein
VRAERGLARVEAVASQAAAKWLRDARSALARWEGQEDVSLVMTMYKPVHKKVRPVPGTTPEEAKTIRKFPEDPLADLPEVLWDPPPFEDGTRVTKDRLVKMKWRSNGFLTEEEVRMFDHILKVNEMGLAFDESERGSFRDDYFSPYKMATIPHEPWAEKNIPIPPGLADAFHKIVSEKLANGAFEPSTSSYRSKYFLVAKKVAGEYRFVIDLQPLNKVTIKDAGLPPDIEDFVSEFPGLACYSSMDIYVGYDNRKLAPESRELTAFMAPWFGLLQYTVLPMGFTNAVPEFQSCMVFILRDEIPKKAGCFIDDVIGKGPKSRYELEGGGYEMIPQSISIESFIESRNRGRRCRH